MKANVNRVILCLVPVVLAAVVVGWAYWKYQKGEGGFRLGVDLVGGTILVYEVDPTRQQEAVKGEELAAALKKRIDPADLYNVTIRPVQGNPPRVEIILPTGGTKQRYAELESWKTLLNNVYEKFPGKLPGDPDGNPYENIPVGQKDFLQREVIDRNKSTPPEEITEFIARAYKVNTDRRALSGEEVEAIKNLISQQGRLEFRILANTGPDGRSEDNDAIQRAKAWIGNPDNAAELHRLAVLGEPPPPPRAEDGGLTFPVSIGGGVHNYSYKWLEVGKEELYTLRLNNAVRNSKNLYEREQWERVAAARGGPEADKQMRNTREEAIPFGNGVLLYSRVIPDPGRLTPKDRAQGKKYEYFILTRDPEPGQEITGQYLAGAKRDVDERGDWAVHFRLNPEGANLFWELTSLNKPSGGEKGFHRQLAIVLDGQIRSAPRLNQPIRSNGQITGGFTAKTVDELVTILRAGALPATLKSEPVSENTMGATLGQDTIDKGTMAVGLAFLAVMAFMVFYYRFAGLVACVALLANLLLTVAFMVLVKATFTLPGLAGLVLMLGMAVDANVLIYERLREERERGASLALALRNGYDRAFPTIIDTHLSSIFTAIVLYVVGNDQLKGFGISLTVGLIISLFTSLYMTRVIFDLWQAKNWLKKLSMLRLFHKPNWDFMAIRYYWFTATIVLTLLGAGLFLWRMPTANAEGNQNESSVLNIDFTGGTAYTGRLRQPMTIAELRKDLETVKPVPGLDNPRDWELPDLSIEQIFTSKDTGNRGSLFTVRTAERDFRKVQRIINARLGDKLKKVELKNYEIAKDNKSVLLEFAEPHSNQPGFASRAQVTSLLNQEGLKGFQLLPASRENEEGLFSKMKLELADPIERAQLAAILDQTKKAFDESPQPERLENFDKQLASNAQEIALYAILASWAALLFYLWFRFGSWTFGAATVLCLIHDLFFTLGVIAACHYVHGTWFGNLLGIGDFKIDLQTVAALLTLVGYSVSDTIVVFDRIREVRGKNPALTPQMINDSVNQTLSRTILSSLTVWVVVIVLYIFGGEGVHLFAFVMIVGVVVGTYSSIYIASPLLLIFGEGAPRRGERPRVQAAPAGA
jgi:SecD/SecF fusion protein